MVLRPVWRFVLRPLWLLVAPPLRFLIARLTPGELGIELTTLLTIAAVGIYLVVLQINLLETDALLPGDNTALDIARDIQSGLLTGIAKALRVIGSLWFVGLCTAATCVFLLWRRRSTEAIARRQGSRSPRSRCRSSSARSSARGPRTRWSERTASHIHPGTPRCR